MFSYRFIFGFVLSLFLAGWANASPPAKQVTIAVGGKSLFYFLPLTIAERQGYFKDEGLDVRIVDFAGGAKALQSLMGGSSDMVSGAFEHNIHMQVKNKMLSCVVVQGRYAGISLSLTPEKANNYHSPKDLKRPLHNH